MNVDLGKAAEYLREYNGEPVNIMEVCGTHTAAIFKSGLRELLSDKIRLISGPGCPVCVTPTSFIDKCCEYAMKEDHQVISFGDMLKVPGEKYSLSQIKGLGGNVHMVYSPFDVLQPAADHPHRQFIIAAVGFETTAPVFALLLDELVKKKLKNVKLLTSLKSAIPAIEWVCTNEKGIDGFLCPGHVSVITGVRTFHELCKKYKKPFVIAGFEEKHILKAVYEIVRSVESARNGTEPVVKNLYDEVVTELGNLKAQSLLKRYFDIKDAVWRGLGQIQNSGYYIKDMFKDFEGGSRELVHDKDLPDECKCADVITGRTDPDKCPMFGGICTPLSAYGPCMVSAEGACGIWYRNR